MLNIDRCPGTLKLGFNTYSASCLRKVFANKKVSHILPYKNPTQSEDDVEEFIANRKRISISGVQDKLSLILDKNKLRLVAENEQGNYILKPIPKDLKLANQVPANEHLTMQIANQVYGIATAPNALIFFKSGDPAYITRRFDVRNDGSKWGKEDFASLAQRTSITHGKDYKYGQISYEGIAAIIKKHVGPYQIEIQKYYKLVLFNFLFSNGDAHLKNFSLLETKSGDYILSPAYDLLNTKIHVADTPLALKKGLFDKGAIRNPTKKDFLKFGEQIGINENSRDKIFDAFLQKSDTVHQLISQSFLSKQAKKAYTIHYNTRLNILKK